MKSATCKIYEMYGTNGRLEGCIMYRGKVIFTCDSSNADGWWSEKAYIMHTLKHQCAIMRFTHWKFT